MTQVPTQFTLRVFQCPGIMLCEKVFVKKCYRLRKNEDFQRIRRNGKSCSDKYLVICWLPNQLSTNQLSTNQLSTNQLSNSRFGFSISKRIGKAVVRNQIKRRLREAVRLRVDTIAPGWDIVFIARGPIRDLNYHQMDAACARLLRRAHLLQETE